MTKFHKSKEWAAFTRKARPAIKASLPAPCVEAYRHPACTGIVYPDQPFDVAHIISHHIDPTQPLSLSLVGPAHPRCNRRAGASEGAKKRWQGKTKADTKRLPPQGSGW